MEGNVTSTISDGLQHGPVPQCRDFSNVTFGAAPGFGAAGSAILGPGTRDSRGPGDPQYDQ
jgi:hypothetical protein